MMINNNKQQQKCDNCGRYFLFMKLFPLNSYDLAYDGHMVCERCLTTDRRRKKE